MIINNVPVSPSPLRLTLSGGGGRATVRTTLNGERKVIVAGPGNPLIVTGDSGDDLVMPASGAAVIEALAESHEVFAAVFPGLRADGSDLIAPRCVILDPPAFPPAGRDHDGTPTCGYQFTITLL